MAKNNIQQLVKGISASTSETPLSDIKMGKGVTFSQEEEQNSSSAKQQKSTKPKEPIYPSKGYMINPVYARQLKIIAVKEGRKFYLVLNDALKGYLDQNKDKLD